MIGDADFDVNTQIATIKAWYEGLMTTLNFVTNRPQNKLATHGRVF